MWSQIWAFYLLWCYPVDYARKVSFQWRQPERRYTRPKSPHWSSAISHPTIVRKIMQNDHLQGSLRQLESRDNLGFNWIWKEPPLDDGNLVILFENSQINTVFSPKNIYMFVFFSPRFPIFNSLSEKHNIPNSLLLKFLKWVFRSSIPQGSETQFLSSKVNLRGNTSPDPHMD